MTERIEEFCLVFGGSISVLSSIVTAGARVLESSCEVCIDNN